MEIWENTVPKVFVGLPNFGLDFFTHETIAAKVYKVCRNYMIIIYTYQILHI